MTKLITPKELDNLKDISKDKDTIARKRVYDKHFDKDIQYVNRCLAKEAKEGHSCCTIDVEMFMHRDWKTLRTYSLEKNIIDELNRQGYIITTEFSYCRECIVMVIRWE